MNPDPNQPQGQPEGHPLEQPQVPSQPAPSAAPLAPTPSVDPIAPASAVDSPTPTAYAAAPVVESAPAPVEVATPNPFGGATSSSAPTVANPFAAAAEPVSSDTPVSAAATDSATDSTPGSFPGLPIDAAPAPQPEGIIGSTPNSIPPAVPQKKSKKKLIILLSAIIGGLIILAGAAFAAYLIFFSVSKDDYQKASDQVSLVRDKYSSDDAISSGSSKASVDAATKAYADFKTESAKLPDLRAIKNDKDLHTAYEAYDTKAKAFITFGDVFIPSMDRFVTAANEVSDLGTGSAAFTSANVQKTIDIYKGIDDISDPTLKKFVDSVITVYTAVLPNAKIYESTTATSAQRYTAITAISDSLDKLSDAGDTLSTEIEAKAKAVSLDDALNDLGTAVTTKLNAAK